MAAYKPTMSYRLIYIFTIHDAQHEGYWKIGKTNFDSVNSYKQLPPNCAELNCAARDRIDQYTKTAMVEYDLQYTELARRTVTFEDGTTDTELFDDDDVHNVLYNSGFSARKFSNSNQDSEWFEVPLSVAIRAIQAVKEGRTALTAAEKSEGQISFLPQTVPAAPKKRAITLRDEQMDCVNQTLRVFRKENSMLWNCKMRFGKTVTAYALIKKAGGMPVLAHPLLYKMSVTELHNLLTELKGYGLQGVEAMYSRNRGNDEAFVRKLASEYGLFITGGTDFHGANKPDLEIGTGEGNLRVPVMLLENLK